MAEAKNVQSGTETEQPTLTSDIHTSSGGSERAAVIDENPIIQVIENDSKDTYFNMEKVMCNYIIVENVLDNLDWRTQLSCARVCRLWRDVVRTLQRKNLRCYDFALFTSQHSSHRRPDAVTLEVSREPVLTRPMFTCAFASSLEYTACEDLAPLLCQPPCTNLHTAMEVVEANILSKDACMLSVYNTPKIYMPLETSQTFQYTLRRRLKPVLCGLYLPRIPNVSCHNIKYQGMETVEQDVYSIIDAICATDIIKGVVVFAEERIMLNDAENLEFLTYFKRKQPDIPFAMGGCVVDFTMTGTGAGERNERELDTMVRAAIFSVPRCPAPIPGPRCHFEMYSLIIPQNCYKKSAMRQEIQRFAASVPEMQYNACLKLSCVGRDKLHRLELELFRKEFPRATIVGCYGNGEIGCEHPARIDPVPLPAKRVARRDPNDYSYTYCTVFVYFCWGKLIRQAGE